MRRTNRGNTVSKASNAKRVKSLVERALAVNVAPIADSDLERLWVDNKMTMEVFKANISSLFPLILLRISEGYSVSKTCKYMKLDYNNFYSFLNYHSRLSLAVKKARRVRRDSVSEIEYILS